ncbi:MAG TPA: type II CAAX endopeptidase family protein [Gaiellaceae bacterium]|nr:type II CAAX endopeptidase family protein [Gaiellaceae bacterium]
MNRRFGTTSAHGTADTKRLAQWLALVGVLALLGYGTRIGAGKPDPEVLYQWSTAIGGFVQDAIVLALVLAIARGSLPLLALRRPVSIGRAALFIGCAIVAIYVFESVYSLVVDPGNEQGLTPSHWEPAHAAAYITNSIVICTWVPLVEELTYRGLGYSLLARFGRRPAIVAVGLAFGLAHGLLLSLPVIVAFGCVLAWIRSRTDSVYPGMALHALFNAIALVAAVTVGS